MATIPTASCQYVNLTAASINTTADAGSQWQYTGTSTSSAYINAATWTPVSNGFWGQSATISTIYFTYPQVYMNHGDTINFDWSTCIISDDTSVAEDEVDVIEKMHKAAELVFAKERAMKLLKKHIGLQRYGLLFEAGFIEVDSQKYAGKKYRVSKNAGDRIEIVDNGKVIDELCILPAVTCPDGDKILSKIVLLECDEDYVLAKSNHFKPIELAHSVTDVNN